MINFDFSSLSLSLSPDEDNLQLHARLVFVCVCDETVIFLQVKREMDLVYGGGSVGLMGLVSQTVYDGGRDVLG